MCGAHQAITHPCSREIRTNVSQKTLLFSESTKSFLCENNGFSLDFTLPKIGGE
jgi:hypothetical protein